MNKIYVFGHKKPDTDSICASISLSYLKNKLGFNTEPATLGDINKETKYVLEYFNLKEPKYLNDVKLQIKDIDYIKQCYANGKTSINDAYNYMKTNGLTGLPIVDDDKKLKGLVTLKELAKELIEGDFEQLNTSYDNILRVLHGKEILKFDNEIHGRIIAASFRSATFVENIKLTSNDILIVGDRQNILKYAIDSKVKLIIIISDLELSKENYDCAKANGVNIIRTEFDTYHASKLINLSNYISIVTHGNTPLCIEQNDYYSKFEELAERTKYSNYPVVNKNGECLGLLPLSLSISKHPKKVILVDHNESDQSVDGLDEANIVEVVDHHKLGVLATTLPINFRNMAVGSSNTIIYSMFKENKIDIPKEIAGAMLSGILSDTLILKSPTTTLYDKIAVYELEKIAEVKYQEYGMNMFNAGSSLEGMSREDIIYHDFKKFKYDNYSIGIGQVLTTNVEDVLNDKDEYIRLLNSIANNENYKILGLYITDIINNGAYVLYNENAASILQESYGLGSIYEGIYLDGIVSRKKQIIPPILETLEKYN